MEEDWVERLNQDTDLLEYNLYVEWFASTIRNFATQVIVIINVSFFLNNVIFL